MVRYTTVSTQEEVRQILALQARNHPAALTPEVMTQQGFVTVQHDPAVLWRMNQAASSIIAKSGEQVIGYCLAMPPAFATAVPVLAPMFDMLAGLIRRGRPLADFRWLVMGQVCVAEDRRGQGIFDGLYRQFRETHQANYDLLITEVAARNTRSRRAHERVGFETLHIYDDSSTGETWHIILWEWASGL